MGNSSSKQRDTLKTYPSFTRSDTQNSAKSARSQRSRRSLSRDSDASSFKTATNSPSMLPHTPHTSRKNSSNTVPQTTSSNNNSSSNLNNINNNSNPNYEMPTLSVTSPESGFSNLQLPPSMAQMVPKQPILRNNSDAQDDLLNSIDENSSTSHHTGNNSTNNNNHHHTDDKNNSHSDNTSSSNLTNSLNNQPVTHPNTVHHSRSNSRSSTNEYPSHELLEKLEVDEELQSISKHPSNPNIDLPTPKHKSSFTTAFGSPRTQSIDSSANSPSAHIDVEELIQRLLDAGYSGKRTKSLCLKNSEIALICARAREIFLSQPTLLELSPPVKIVGDVHGQFGDLIRMFTKCGFPPAANYLFLGDYVDRGKQSLETILLLLCYKIKYPENFFLLRGNHECANVTRVYGFYDECKRRCNIKTWKLFIDTFNTLPLAAIVAGKIFCVHGGLSPVLNSMDEIRNVNRPTDVPDFGLINDLLWSDPADAINEWEDNERGVSYCFNKLAINKFLARFGFDLVCRAHMVVEDGYEFFNDHSLVTVFSAPNYCGEFDNWGAVMSVSEELLCSFELLDPLDSAALKQVMKKGKHERRIANLAAQAQGSNGGSFSNTTVAATISNNA